MMNMNKENTFICVLLSIVALSCVLHAEAQGVISPFCAEPTVTPAAQAFCSKMVGKATTWEQAALASVKRVLRKHQKSMKPILATIEKELSTSIPISKKYQILDICRNSYKEAVRGLKNCPALITVGPFISYGSTLTSVYTSIEDCKDAIVEEKTQPEIVDVTRFTQSIQNLIDVALVISKKDPRVIAYDETARKGELKDSAGDPSLIGPINPPA